VWFRVARGFRVWGAGVRVCVLSLFSLSLSLSLSL